MKRFFFITLLLIFGSFVKSFSQNNSPLSLARNYIVMGNVDSAIFAYQFAYDNAPFDVKLYNEYLSVLMEHKKYDKAEKLINRMIELRPEDPNMVLDKAQLLFLNGNKKEYRKIIEELIDMQYKKNSYHVNNLANAFISRKMIDEAVLLYERATAHHQHTQIFGKELMNLYLEQGHIDRVIPYFAEYLPYYPNLNEDLKSKILKLIEKDPKNKEKIEKALSKEIKKNNEYLNEYLSLMNWLKQLDGNKNDALDELISINKKNPEAGLHDIIQIGNDAINANDYIVGEKAFSYLLQSKNEHVRELAYAGILKNNYYHLYHQRPYTRELVMKTLQMFESYFKLYPTKKREIEYVWYADVIAKFDRKPDVAIQMMNNLLEEPNLPKRHIGIIKLSLGDFYLFSGKVWDANLSYAQVDKLFRQDKFGEEARYKQAKLAFYRGDFKWAQNQLNVLKASTTELISNDAMQLSILITENSFNDTVSEPLKKYAKADLLMYQQQYDEAEKELKDILELYPEHDLVDDVYLLLGNLSVDYGKFSEAVTYYKMIIEKYYDDVIADDALLRLAQVYNFQLNDKENAKIYYEKLITDFTNSSLVSIARAEYLKLTTTNKL